MIPGLKEYLAVDEKSLLSVLQSKVAVCTNMQTIVFFVRQTGMNPSSILSANCPWKLGRRHLSIITLAAGSLSWQSHFKKNNLNRCYFPKQTEAHPACLQKKFHTQRLFQIHIFPLLEMSVWCCSLCRFFLSVKYQSYIHQIKVITHFHFCKFLSIWRLRKKRPEVWALKIYKRITKCTRTTITIVM